MLQTKVVISSANVTKLNFIPIHFNAPELTIILGCLQNKDPEKRLFRLFWVEIANNSRTMIKRNGESGLP